MYIPLIIHPGLSSIKFKTFFQMCRLDGIAYDLEIKTGTIFLLFQDIGEGVIGIMTVGKHRRETVKLMYEALEFLVRQGGYTKRKHKELAINDKSDEIFFSDVLLAVRMIHKEFERKMQRLKQASEHQRKVL